MSNLWQATRDRKDPFPCAARLCRRSRVTHHVSAFTLIEIMIVVAIIGLMAAMGVPAIFQVFRKEGMRLAVSDVQQLLADTRAKAIYSGTTTEVVFHPQERRIDPSVTLPDNVDIAMLDINMYDYGAAESARVRFFPNGTCDELTLVLHSGDEWQKITLEFSTATTTVGPVNR
jgi:prepilin-type N-terminal cleavage/methylation domain-containing protein